MDGRKEVWCTFVEDYAISRYGFCAYCGATDHEETGR